MFVAVTVTPGIIAPEASVTVPLNLALLDWLLHGVVSSIFVKLAFAMVLQLSALTAFIVSRKSL